MRLDLGSILLSALLFCSPVFATDIEKMSGDNWLLLKSPNFEIITELDEEKGRHLIENLEAYRYFSIDIMNLSVVEGLKPLRILAISDSSTFKALGLPEMWEGAFKTNIFGYSAIANVNGYIPDSKVENAGRHTLFHEYNHFLARFAGNIQMYPLWYNEGMAEYWATFKFDGEKIYVGDFLGGRTNSMFDKAGNLKLKSQKILNVKELPLNSNERRDKEFLHDFYAQSFYLIHYFNSSPALLAALQKYIQLLNYGYRESDAFQKAFNLTYAELDENAKGYLKNKMVRRVISLKSRSATLPKPAISAAKLDKPNFYLLLSEMLPNYSAFDNETKKQLLNRAIALNPNSADAKARLLHYNWAEAPEKMVSEAEALDANNAMLLSYKADKLADAANDLRAAGMSSWEETMKQSRNIYRRAIKSDPSLTLPYVGLSSVYDFMPASEPLKEAIVALNVATVLSPRQRRFAQLADIYIRMDNPLDALPALRSALAYSEEESSLKYSLIHANLEMLHDLRGGDSVLTKDGMEFASGAIYKGVVENGKPAGRGKITSPTGSFFEGAFVNGVMQGQGKIVTFKGFMYEGEFQNGIARGKGKLAYPEKSMSYEGDVYYSFPNGKGILTSSAGRYEGDFWYSWQQGKGTFTSANGKLVLQGRWIENRFAWPEIDGISFVGSISEKGKRDGHGLCLTPAKSTLEWCTYKDGERQKEG